MPDAGEARPTASVLSQQDVALLAHEVRGALTVISGFSELLRRPGSPEDRDRALDGISRAVRRIDSLLQSAVEGAVTTSTASEPIRLAALATSVVEEQRVLSGRDITLDISGDPHVAGISEALERVLDNLIGNSLKYSLSGSPVEVGVAIEDDHGILWVADRGPGIPEGERERVLLPFERLESHASLPGTGLGLTVVNSVVRAHGGRIEILDRTGGGAIVRIELPLAGRGL